MEPLEILGVNPYSPRGAQLIINEYSAPNYPPPVGFAKVVSLGKRDCEYRMRFIDRFGMTQEDDVLDGQGMYSAHNIGISNEACVRIRKELADLMLSGMAAIGRDKNHDFYAEAIPVMRMITNLDKFLPKLSGNEVVDDAAKAARKFTGKPGIMAFADCFHGRNLTAISLSSSPKARDGFGPFVPYFIGGIPFNDIDALEEVLEQYKGAVAGCIVELVQGEGGVNVPDETYPIRLQELLHKHGVLLIVDEIQTGMGRVGGRLPETLFAYQSYGVTPDLACFGKAVGGGEVPFSFLGGRKDIMDCFEPGTNGLTWSAYPLGCKAFTIAVEETVKGRLSVESREKGAFMLEALRRRLWQFPRAVKEVRGRGLFIGVEIEPRFCTGRELSYALLHHGVWAKETGEDGQVIRLAPPLTISLSQIETCMNAFEEAIRMTSTEHHTLKEALAKQENL